MDNVNRNGICIGFDDSEEPGLRIMVFVGDVKGIYKTVYSNVPLFCCVKSEISHRAANRELNACL